MTRTEGTLAPRPEPAGADAEIYGLLQWVIGSPGDRAARLILADALEDLIPDEEKRRAVGGLRVRSGRWELVRIFTSPWRGWLLRWHPVQKGYRGLDGERWLNVHVVEVNHWCQRVGCWHRGAPPRYTPNALTARRKTRWRWWCDLCYERHCAGS